MILLAEWTTIGFRPGRLQWFQNLCGVTSFLKPGEVRRFEIAQTMFKALYSRSLSYVKFASAFGLALTSCLLLQPFEYRSLQNHLLCKGAVRHERC